MIEMGVGKSGMTRLATVRRLYFYLIALISLIVGLVAMDGLLNILSDAWLGKPSLYEASQGDYTRNAVRDVVARNGGLLLVAVPIFLLHWRYMQRRQNEPGEARAALRKFFLYGASAAAVGYALTRGYELVQGMAVLAFGGALADSSIWPDGWLHLAAMILLGGLLQLYFHHVLQQDGDYGQETGFAGVLRRLYQTVAGLVGLSLLIVGGAQIVETGWRALTGLLVTAAGFDWWRHLLSDGVAMLIIGSLLARINWQRWLAITARQPTEAQSALRRFYLYGALVIGALATLAPAAGLLHEILLILFGGGSGDVGDLLERLATPIGYIPLGLVAWVWHGRYLRQEADQYGESSEGVTVRRLYYYAMAATGLVLLWFGLVNIVQTLIDQLLAFAVMRSEGRIWVEPLANGLSLLAVGAPIWSLHWRAVQSVARQEDAAGRAERGSGPRRVYLYAVALVGALLILFELASVVYRILLLLLGDLNVGLFSIEMANEIARSLIAGALWGVHLVAIRDDGRLGADLPQPVEDLAARRSTLQQRIQRLETELAAARAELAQLE
jgi:hypothetical protein